MNDLKNLGVVVGNELSQIIVSEAAELFNELSINRLNKMIKDFDLNNLLGGIFKSTNKSKKDSSAKINDMFEEKRDESIFENELEIVDEILADEDDDDDVDEYDDSKVATDI